MSTADNMAFILEKPKFVFGMTLSCLRSKQVLYPLESSIQYLLLPHGSYNIYYVNLGCSHSIKHKKMYFEDISALHT